MWGVAREAATPGLPSRPVEKNVACGATRKSPPTYCVEGSLSRFFLACSNPGSILSGVPPEG
jgi:hypothetical protein